MIHSHPIITQLDELTEQWRQADNFVQSLGMSYHNEREMRQAVWDRTIETNHRLYNDIWLDWLDWSGLGMTYHVYAEHYNMNQKLAEQYLKHAEKVHEEFFA